MIAFIFPGQGAQYAGMGRAMADAYPEAREVFDRADAVLGFPLSRLCWEGPEEELALTANTQPAVLATSVACLAVLQARGVTPAVAAGLSLGEYTALVCAGALDLAQALRLVRLRGIFMQEAVSGRRTAMAAIVGLDAAAVERVCAEASARGVVEPANFNSPGQVVIAGDEEAVEDGIARARAAGARRAVRLAVSAPFHTSLMRPAARRLAEVLAGVPLRDARIPVVSNVTAAPVRRADDIRRLLAEQVASPVRWEMSVRAMAAGGVTTFVEVGPGTTLAGMVRKTVPDARVLHVDGPATLQQTLRALPEAQGGGPGAAGGAHG